MRTFHHKSARFLTGRYITQIDDEWIYPETKRTLELAHLLPIEDYIMNRKNKIQLYASETEIYNECIAKSLYVKADNSLQWWTEYNKQYNEICQTVYDTYDIDEIELEWDTEIQENEINEVELN